MTPELVPPCLIQGGMGVAVSGWRLARAVSRRGHLGVVSGTALDTILVRRLQDGDPGGHIREALSAFPRQDVVEGVLQRYLLPAGRRAGEPYRQAPMHTHRSAAGRQDLHVLGCFAEVHLAKHGHLGPVGVNLLTKVQIPTMASLYGAMLAGVDYVLMGAGIPRSIPAILDALSVGKSTTMYLDVRDLQRSDPAPVLEFDPARYGAASSLTRPSFIPIVSSHVLASVLARKSSDGVQGFVIESPQAGGHNAPPRGVASFDELGQPVYGDRDLVDLTALRGLGLPFWLAGGMSTPERVAGARENGAAGVQVGTLFAFCRESGLEAGLRRRVLELVSRGEAEVFTDPRASSTGYPFKVLSVPGTLSDGDVYLRRRRACDLGYLREAYRRSDGTVGYRCPAEPVRSYVRKGGRREDALGRKCLCNGLSATVGLGQQRANGRGELAIVTSGDDIGLVRALLEGGRTDYSADDVIDYLLPHGGQPLRR